jgi:hypothetical protein
MTGEQRYISNELTHLVGRKLKSYEEQYDILIKILKERYITYPPHEKKDRNARELITYYTADFTKNEMYEPSMVCFCDIPVCDLSIHIKKYSPFGLSFDKEFIACKGGGPVYYVSKTAAPAWPVGQDSEEDRGHVFDQKIKECYHLLDDLICAENEWSDRARIVQSFLGGSIFAYTKCFDHTLMDRHNDNYYFEREWRVLGNLKFNIRDVRRIIIPENYAVKFRKDFPGYCGQLTFATSKLTAAGQ